LRTNDKDNVEINEKVGLLIETDGALQFVSGLGTVSDVGIPILKEVRYDNDYPDGQIKIFWEIKNVNNNDDESKRKLLIQYVEIECKDDGDIKVNNDEKKWNSKEIHIDNDLNQGSHCVEIDKLELIYLN